MTGRREQPRSILLLRVAPWTLPRVAARTSNVGAACAGIVAIWGVRTVALLAETCAIAEPYRGVADFLSTCAIMAFPMAANAWNYAVLPILVVGLAGLCAAVLYRSLETRWAVMRAVFLSPLALIAPACLWSCFRAIVRLSHPNVQFGSGLPQWTSHPVVHAIGSWWTALALLLVWAVWVVVTVRRAVGDGTLSTVGLCRECGYPRAGLADDAPCPECGAAEAAS